MEPSHRGLQVKNAHLSADGRASFAGSAVAILAVLDEAPHLQGGFRELPGIRRSEDPKAYLLLPAAQASARTQAVSIHPASPGSRPATARPTLGSACSTLRPSRFWRPSTRSLGGPRCSSRGCFRCRSRRTSRRQEGCHGGLAAARRSSRRLATPCGSAACRRLLEPSRGPDRTAGTQGVGSPSLRGCGYIRPGKARAACHRARCCNLQFQVSPTWDCCRYASQLHNNCSQCSKPILKPTQKRGDGWPSTDLKHRIRTERQIIGSLRKPEDSLVVKLYLTQTASSKVPGPHSVLAPSPLPADGRPSSGGWTPVRAPGPAGTLTHHRLCEFLR